MRREMRSMNELKPPLEHAHLRWHWLRRDGEDRPWEWVNSYWSDGHEGSRIWPGMPGGWTYSHPCDPAAIIVDAGNEAMLRAITDAVHDAAFPIEESGSRDILGLGDAAREKIARSVLTALAKLGART
jgi:hypothetical protein